MKQTVLRLSLFFVVIILFSSMTTPKIKNSQKEFNTFFLKRALLFKSISELEESNHAKFNFIEKFKIKQAKKRISQEFRKNNLLDECDIITLKNGEEIKGIVTEVGTSEIKYKKCENKNGPIYSLRKADIFMIKYANGSKDFFGNVKPTKENAADIVNSDEVKTDGLAIASMSLGIGGFALGIAGLALLQVTMCIAGAGFALAAVILGAISFRRIKKSKGKLKGKGFALTGLIAGIVVLSLSLLGFVLSQIIFDF